MQMKAKLLCGVAALAMLTACGAARSREQSEAGMGSKYDTNNQMSESEIEREEIDDGRKEFDQEAADVVLKRGARKVAECAKTSKAEPGEGEIQATFDGEKGRITEVELPSYWAEASAGAQKCIKNAFVGEYVPPFEGGNKTLPFTITIPEPGAEKKKKKKE
jgi:hypothetical protein